MILSIHILTYSSIIWVIYFPIMMLTVSEGCRIKLALLPEAARNVRKTVGLREKQAA